MPVTENRLSASSDIRKITQGESITLTVELFDVISKQVLPTSGATAALATLPGTTAPVTKALGSGVALSADPGRLTVHLSATDTAALKVGDEQWWQMQVTLADASIRIAQVPLEVVASLF